MDLNTTLNWFNTSSVWSGLDAFATIVSFVSLIIVIPFISKYFKIFNWLKKNYLVKCTKNYIVVCGLGKNNRKYIDSELNDDFSSIIVIEQDINNRYIEDYIKRGIVVVIGDASDISTLKALSITNAKHILISVGNDVLNLEITTQILDIDLSSNLYVHIEDRSLRHFHKDNGILESNNIKIFSYYEEASRELFEKFDIDGKGDDIIDSSTSFSIVVIGNTNLACEIIGQACVIGQLPNENKMTIYCIDKDIKEFKKYIEINYTEIYSVANVTLEYVSLDENSIAFYRSEIWHQNMTNIIIALDSEQSNLDIASNLANITFLEDIVDKKLKTNIILALFNSYNLSKKIKENNMLFENFQIFGDAKDICDKKYIINALRDKKAIAINNRYKEQKAKEGKKSKDWDELNYFEKESNRASADHGKIKQKYLNLHSDEKATELLAKCEHNRWNAYHYLNGYRYMKKEDSENNVQRLKKFHHCLIEYNELSNEYKDLDREIIKDTIK